MVEFLPVLTFGLVFLVLDTRVGIGRKAGILVLMWVTYKVSQNQTKQQPIQDWTVPCVRPRQTNLLNVYCLDKFQRLYGDCDVGVIYAHQIVQLLETFHGFVAVRVGADIVRARGLRINHTMSFDLFCPA